MLQTIHDDLHDALVQLVQECAVGSNAVPGQMDGQMDGRTKGQLRRCFGAEVTELLITVLSLQAKAVRKFGEGVWWTTTRSLQQATAGPIAELKASWLMPDERIVSVADHCCGCGGDAMAIARRCGDASKLTIVDTDPLMVAMARRNVTSIQASTNVDASTCDVTSVRQREFDSIHIDPDRRPGEKRTSSPDHYEPAWGDLTNIVRAAKSAIVKLAPAATIETDGWDTPTHRAWLSLTGDVREQDLLLGEAVAAAGLSDGGRSAVIVRNDAPTKVFSTDALEAFTASFDSIEAGAWLVDPDASIRAAGLTTTFASVNRLSIPGKPSGFLVGSGDECLQRCEGFGTVEKVSWVGAADDRKLRQLFRSRDWFPQTIKVRGTDHDPNKLFKHYRACGSTPVKLWIGCAAKNVFAAVTEQRSLVEVAFTR